MIQTLKCPECSAPLDYPAHGGMTMRCPYCNASVLLPGQHPSPTSMRKPAALGGAARQIPNSSDPRQAASYAMRVGIGATLGTLLLAGLIVAIILLSVRRQVTRVSSSLSFTPAPITLPAPRFIPPPAALSPPAPPSFAHMVLEFGTEGIGAGGFTDARSVAVDNQGHVYVGEYSDGRVQVFDPRGKFLSTWSVGTGGVLLNLAADRHGIVYAVTPSHLYRYEGITGKPMGEFESIREGITQSFSDVFPAIDGDLYAIAGDHEIVMINPDGQIKKTIDAREKVGENLTLQRILSIGTGEIFAMDSSKGIFKFAPDGHYINRFGAGAAGAARNLIRDHSFSPRNFAADGKGRIYVSESGASVLVFDSDGNYLDSFGGTEIVFGIAITDENEIYGCFRNRCSIRKFVLDKR
jgi:DNA-directed RNA polymerase subunit RPC12/RpoP